MLYQRTQTIPDTDITMEQFYREFYVENRYSADELLEYLRRMNVDWLVRRDDGQILEAFLNFVINVVI